MNYDHIMQCRDAHCRYCNAVEVESQPVPLPLGDSFELFWMQWTRWALSDQGLHAQATALLNRDKVRRPRYASDGDPED